MKTSENLNSIKTNVPVVLDFNVLVTTGTGCNKETDAECQRTEGNRTCRPEVVFQKLVFFPSQIYKKTPAMGFSAKLMQVFLPGNL